MAQKQSVALNLRVSPSVRDRLDTLADRYEMTITAISRQALVIGLETLEGMRGGQGVTPVDPGPYD